MLSSPALCKFSCSNEASMLPRLDVCKWRLSCSWNKKFSSLLIVGHESNRAYHGNFPFREIHKWLLGDSPFMLYLAKRFWITFSRLGILSELNWFPSSFVFAAQVKKQVKAFSGAFMSFKSCYKEMWTFSSFENLASSRGSEPSVVRRS